MLDFGLTPAGVAVIPLELSDSRSYRLRCNEIDRGYLDAVGYHAPCRQPNMSIRTGFQPTFDITTKNLRLGGGASS